MRLLVALALVSSGACRLWEPLVEPRLHSTGDASSGAALLLPQILPVFSVVAPGSRGASPVSVQRLGFTTGS